MHWKEIKPLLETKQGKKIDEKKKVINQNKSIIKGNEKEVAELLFFKERILSALLKE